MDINEIDLSKYKDLKIGRIFNFAQMAESYEEYIQNIQGRKVSTSIKSFDDAIGLVRPSQVVTFVGGTNIGKTGIAMNICFSNSTLLQDSIIALFELEIDENEIYERALQMEFDMNTSEVERAFLSKDKELLNKFKSINSKYSNIVSIIKRVRIEEIGAYILAIQDIYKKRVGMAIVDYGGLVVNDFHDDYAKITYTLQKLKETALHLQLPIINFSQVPRADIKGENKKVGLNSGKGSGEVENSSQIVISLNAVTELPADQTITSEVYEKCSGEKPTHYLIEAKIEKKKQGDYEKTFLLFNKKNLRLTDLKSNELF